MLMDLKRLIGILGYFKDLKGSNGIVSDLKGFKRIYRHFIWILRDMKGF